MQLQNLLPFCESAPCVTYFFLCQIYLRNLGIDQSPGTILTPFVPRGPIREVEFSPSELRTLKESTDTLTRTVRQPPGMGKENLVSWRAHNWRVACEVFLGLVVSSVFLLKWCSAWVDLIPSQVWDIWHWKSVKTFENTPSHQGVVSMWHLLASAVTFCPSLLLFLQEFLRKKCFASEG